MEHVAYWWGYVALWSLIPALTLYLLVSFLASSWRINRASVAVTLLILAFDLVLVVGLVWRLAGGERSDPAADYLRAGLYTVLAGSVWWLLAVLLHTQVSGRRLMRQHRVTRRETDREKREDRRETDREKREDRREVDREKREDRREELRADPPVD